MPALVSLVIAMMAFRFAPAPENFAPLGAFALIGGFYLKRSHAMLVPIAALFLSDLFLNHQAGHPLFHWSRLIDFSAFILIGVIGIAARHRGWKLKVAAAAVTPFVFFLLSNFGVWLGGLSLTGLPYAKTPAGLLECYTAALPFLRGTLLGDWGFAALFVMLMELASITRKTRVPHPAI